MDFAKMRQRIIFLKPQKADENSMSEDVIGWYPYHPIKNITSEDMHVTQNNDCMFKNGVLYTFSEQLHDFGVWACVAPMSGREYAEAQKIRAETTYNITTRYTENVSSNMKILYGAKVFDIVSVLDVGGRKKELKIIATEADRYGKE